MAGALFGFGVGEADREVALLAWELGRDESKESDDELVLGDRLGMTGNGMSEEEVDSIVVGLPFIAIAVSEEDWPCVALCHRSCDLDTSAGLLFRS